MALMDVILDVVGSSPAWPAGQREKDREQQWREGQADLRAAASPPTSVQKQVLSPSSRPQFAVIVTVQASWSLV